MENLHALNPPRKPLGEARRLRVRALRALAAAHAAEADALEAEVDIEAAPADAILEFPFGLEVKAARALIRAGKLRAARIGRKLYSRGSDVVALVDALAVAPVATPLTPRDDTYETVISLERAKARRGAR